MPVIDKFIPFVIRIIFMLILWIIVPVIQRILVPALILLLWPFSRKVILPYAMKALWFSIKKMLLPYLRKTTTQSIVRNTLWTNIRNVAIKSGVSEKVRMFFRKFTIEPLARRKVWPFARWAV